MAGENILLIGPYPQWDMAELEVRYSVHKLWLADDKPAFLAERAGRVRAIATRGELGADADLMAALPKLEIVSVYGVGTDAVDRGYARSRNIAVTNTPDVLTEDVADIGIGLLLAAARQIPQADTYVRSGRWAASNMGLTTRVWGKRIGIVGMGRIGAALARRAVAFGGHVSYFGRTRHTDLPYEFVPNLVELAKCSDFLIVTVAGGAETRNLVNAKVLAALGPEGILVNVSRGSTVDEPALIDALENGAIKAAGLDVFWNEPHIDPHILALNNVVLQPHHGSGTLETRKAMGQLVRDNLAAHFSGRPLPTPVI